MTPVEDLDGTTYEIRVGGHLDDHWGGWLGGLVVARHEDGTTTLTGPVADQARLHGILGGLRDIGAPIVSVFALTPGDRGRS